MRKYLRQTVSCVSKKDKDPQIGFKTGAVLATFSNTRSAFCLQHRCNNLASGYEATFAKAHGYCSILLYRTKTTTVQLFFQTKPNNIPKHGSWINMFSSSIVVFFLLLSSPCESVMPDYSKSHFENLNVSSFPARSERYHHLETEEEDTNDEDFNVELRQFSSCSHRFSKVSLLSQTRTPITAAQDVTAINELMPSSVLVLVGNKM